MAQWLEAFSSLSFGISLLSVSCIMGKKASPRKKSKLNPLPYFTRGLLMGTADVIPGVSGGTIAFITGIYSRLIAALDAFHFKHAQAFGKFLFFFYSAEKRRKALTKIQELDWPFLLPLLGGILCALFGMVHVIPFFLRDYPFYTYAFFNGLIIASIPIPLRRMRKKVLEFSVLFLFALFLFFLTSLKDSGEGSLHPLYLVFSGALSICAMILPGISGSYILVILGQYRLVAEAARDGDFFVLSFFIIGIITGLFSFVRLLRFLLARFESLSMAGLTGMMLGSLHGIWPLKFTDASIQESPSFWLGGLAAVFLGALIVFSLEYFSKKLEITK